MTVNSDTQKYNTHKHTDNLCFWDIYENTHTRKNTYTSKASSVGYIQHKRRKGDMHTHTALNKLKKGHTR